MRPVAPSWQVNLPTLKSSIEYVGDIQPTMGQAGKRDKRPCSVLWISCSQTGVGISAPLQTPQNAARRTTIGKGEIAPDILHSRRLYKLRTKPAGPGSSSTLRPYRISKSPRRMALCITSPATMFSGRPLRPPITLATASSNVRHKQSSRTVQPFQRCLTRTEMKSPTTAVLGF